MRISMIICLVFIFALKISAQPLEEMEYDLRFGFIKGGKATLTANNEKLNKKPTIHYRMRGRTTGLVDKIYEVNDVYESWVDPVSFLPLKSVRNVKERKYRFYDEVIYDQVNDSVFSLKEGRIKVPPNLNDMISVFFYIRQNSYFEDMLAGKKVELPVFHGDDLFLMHLVYLGTKTIETKLGKKLCYVVSPQVPKGKLLKTSDALRIYITKDEHHLPIYAEFDMMMGALKCELNSYKINGVNQMDK